MTCVPITVLAALLVAQDRELSPSTCGALTGPHLVGTTAFHWIDEEREETFTGDPDDARLVSVQVWYPTTPDHGAPPAPYVLDPIEYAGAADLAPVFGLASRSFLDAPLVAGARKLPVLVYHHGGGWTRFSGSFVTEQLASHGYVVFGVEHIGFSKTTHRPDGALLELDALEEADITGDLRTDALASWADLDARHFPVWRADASFVLDRIEALAATEGRFAGRLDLERIGMLGWSFGGALSIQMLRDDERVRAAVDQDGQLFGDVAAHGVSRPFLLMHARGEEPTGETGEVLKELLALTREQDAALVEASKGPRYELTIQGTQHGHFSDLMLFYPIGAKEIDALRGHEIICDYTLAFFDRHLRGGEGELLRRESSPYSEVRLTSWR